jgi:hypothetical protein
MADEVADVSKLGAEGGDYSTVGGVNIYNRNGEEQPSLLSIEEQQALQPKEIKVVNPWIHEQTHKEYLETVKVCLSSSNIIIIRGILFNLNLGFAG